jgi:hypothetical protein
MRAFKVHLNGKKLCLAGISDDCVLTAIVNYVAGRGGSDMFLQVGGLQSSVDKHLRWVEQKPLRINDEIRIEILDTDSVDEPTERYPVDPAKNLAHQKRYVRQMAKRFGWKIQTRAKKSRPT